MYTPHVFFSWYCGGSSGVGWLHRHVPTLLEVTLCAWSWPTPPSRWSGHRRWWWYINITTYLCERWSPPFPWRHIQNPSSSIAETTWLLITCHGHSIVQLNSCTCWAKLLRNKIHINSHIHNSKLHDFHFSQMSPLWCQSSQTLRQGLALASESRF